MKGPKGGARRVGAEGCEAQNFGLFPLSRHNFHSSFTLLGVFSENCERHTKCAFGLLWNHFV